MNFLYTFFLLILPYSLSFGQVTWQSTLGPEGGTIEALFVFENGDIFAGNSTGVIFKSQDNGDSWNLLYGDFGFTRINEVRSSPSGALLAATGDGLFLSIDKGANWQLLNNNGLYSYVNTVLAPSADSLYLGASEGLFLSTDNGESWVEADSAINETQVVTLVETANGDFFVGTITGVFRSTDNGVAWQPANVGLDNDNSLVIRDLAVKANGALFAATHDGIYLSTDNGDSWQRKSDGINNDRMGAVAVSSDGNIYAGTSVIGAGIFVSINDGDNWTQIGAPPFAVKTIVTNDSGDMLAGTNVSGVYRSTDGTTTQQVNSGLNSSIIIDLVWNASGNLIAIGNNSIYQYSADSETWLETPPDTIVSFASAAFAENTGYLFAGSRSQGVFRSTDNGNTWKPANEGLTNLFVNALYAEADGNIWAGTTDGQIFHSSNNGDSWVELTTSPGIPEQAFFQAIAVNADGYIFAGTNSNGAYRSTDNGETWQDISAGLSSPICRDFDFTQSGDIVITVDDAIFFSNNNGDSWVDMQAPDLYYEAGAIDGTDNIFAATFDNGVWFWSASDSSWTEVNDNLPKTNINAICLDDNGTVFIGTAGAGVFKGNMLPTSVSVKRDLLPKLVSLFQNYPNPFNPTTEITYHVAKAGQTKLEIFNLMGQKIRVLVNEPYHSSGVYSVTWDGLDSRGQAVAGGIYLYRITAGGKTMAKKMVLIK